jgi:hypothetical protein
MKAEAALMGGTREGPLPPALERATLESETRGNPTVVLRRQSSGCTAGLCVWTMVRVYGWGVRLGDAAK